MSEYVEPVQVHVASVADGLGPVQPDTRQRVLVPRTVILTSDEPAKPLAPPNPDRVFLGIIANSNAVVISRTKGDAQAAGNLESSITNPNGAYIPSGILIWVPEATSEVWASTGNYPTMVSVLEVTRR
jgi:hypothetical protein